MASRPPSRLHARFAAGVAVLVVVATGIPGCSCDPPACPPGLGRISGPMGPCEPLPMADAGPPDAPVDAPPIDAPRFLRPPKHAVMLSNFDTDCTAVAGTIACSRLSAAANVIYASAATEAGFTTFDPETTIFEGVSVWSSERGVSPIVLTTPRATVTATYGTDRYAISGLTRPFAGAETLTLTVPGASPAIDPVVLTAPPDPPRFGAPSGLATEVRVAEGTFDVLFVYASDAAGTSGVLREIPASTMTLRGSDRVAPILPADVVAALDARGIVLSHVTVGPYREVWTSALFSAGEVPLQAGYLVDVPVAALGSP
jgi:hypothetical protein